MEERRNRWRVFTTPMVVLMAVLACSVVLGGAAQDSKGRKRHAYAAMMYMGTPRDYEFYVATRVMMRSIAKLKIDADLVVIASVDVPIEWVRTLKEEDGVKVVTVENLKNPYELQQNFNVRFKLTLNKLYAWSLVDYDRVVMLDSDNIFLQNIDELFQCGQFCAVFINPCIFHTGLFVLQLWLTNRGLSSWISAVRAWRAESTGGHSHSISPSTRHFLASITLTVMSFSGKAYQFAPSMDVFKDMLHELEMGRSNPDGADQGFLASYFPDLLDKPMFHPPLNGTKLDGTYRLPLGYQMDASYYYLKLRWSIPCGPNSVMTFPSAPWLKPWYWWSWPVLPLGISWHEQRRKHLGYTAELPVMLIQAAVYIGIIAVTRLARPNLSKLCYNRRPEKVVFFLHSMLKVAVSWSLIAAYTVPFFLVPRTVHPLLGWSLYFLGTAALASIAINSFLLPPLSVLTPWFGFLGALLVMAYPWYTDGVVRALVLFAYAFCCAPVVWNHLMKVMSSLHSLLEREAFFPRLGESAQISEFNKLF